MGYVVSPQPFHPQALRAAADEDELGKLWYARSYSRPTVKPGETLMIGDQTLQSLAPVMVAVTVCVLLVGQTSKPERKVGSNVITSLRDPQVRIELPKSAQYVGADRWILYDIADCELHAFVEADTQKNVQRLYWVQFESYLPSRPELRHKYDSPRHMQMDGMDFYVDTWVRGMDSSIREGSDLEHILALIRGKGYKVPPGMMSVRLVHLLGEQKRKELMIIYSEDVVPTGFTANQLQEGGSARSQWPAIEKELIERAHEKVTLQPRKRVPGKERSEMLYRPVLLYLPTISAPSVALPSALRVLPTLSVIQRVHRIDLCQAYAGLDTAPVRFPKPFERGVRFSLATGLHVITAHERRHLWQAWRVRRAAEGATA